MVGPSLSDRVAFEDPPARQLDGRCEALAGEQHGVGQEGVQLREVLRAALREVGVRLRRDAGGDRRQLHHLRVRRLLAAERDDRLAGGEDGVDPLLPVPAPAEDADHDHVGRSSSAGRSVTRFGFAGRQAAPDARADSRSVSEVDSRRITGTAPGVVRGACVGPFLGILVPGRGGGRGSSRLPSAVLGHGGGTAPDSHRLPGPRSRSGLVGVRFPLVNSRTFAGDGVKLCDRPLAGAHEPAAPA